MADEELDNYTMDDTCGDLDEACDELEREKCSMKEDPDKNATFIMAV